MVTHAEVGANEVVVGALQRQVCAQFVFVFGEGERLAAQRRVLLAQGQVEPLDAARADLARIDPLWVSVDHPPGHRDQRNGGRCMELLKAMTRKPLHRRLPRN